MTTIDTLPPNNLDWDFWRSIAQHADLAAAWPIAFWAIREATGCDGQATRDFFNSRHGWYFTDDVVNAMPGRSLGDATAAAMARWMAWRIDGRTSREMDIPQGPPYVNSFVIQAGIKAESATA